MTTKSEQQREEVIQLIKQNRLFETSFWEACPYTLSELHQRNNKEHIKNWRQVGMVWLWLSGYSKVDAAKFFLRNHCATIHAIGVFKDACNGFYPKQKKIIDMVMNENRRFFKTVQLSKDLKIQNMVDLEQEMFYKLPRYELH